MDQIRDKLAAAFRPDQVEWRILRSGLKKDGTAWAVVWPYVDAKKLMERLDDVFGVTGWQDSYKEARGGLVCELSVLADGKWITKSGASGATSGDRGGEGIDQVKEMETRAFRRACEKLGVCRYFHLLPTLFAATHKDDRGQFKAKVKDAAGRDAWYSWDPPQLWPGEKRALPERRLPEAVKIIEEAPAPKAEAEGMTEESAVRHEIFKLLSENPFTQEDRIVVIRVIERIGNLAGLKAYLSQWQKEKEKRVSARRPERVSA